MTELKIGDKVRVNKIIISKGWRGMEGVVTSIHKNFAGMGDMIQFRVTKEAEDTTFTNRKVGDLINNPGLYSNKLDLIDGISEGDLVTYTGNFVPSWRKNVYRVVSFSGTNARLDILGKDGEPTGDQHVHGTYELAPLKAGEEISPSHVIEGMIVRAEGTSNGIALTREGKVTRIKKLLPDEFLFEAGPLHLNNYQSDNWKLILVSIPEFRSDNERTLAKLPMNQVISHGLYTYVQAGYKNDKGQWLWHKVPRDEHGSISIVPNKQVAELLDDGAVILK